jgi:hypothetical protein
MACAELEKMRQEARELYKLLQEKRRKARAHALQSESGIRAPRSDFEPFLSNRISSLSEKISYHISQHRCE